MTLHELEGDVMTLVEAHLALAGLSRLEIEKVKDGVRDKFTAYRDAQASSDRLATESRRARLDRTIDNLEALAQRICE